MKTENELIAEFMGLQFDPHKKDGCNFFTEINEDGWISRNYCNPKYDTSWDALMPVVEKIERLGNRCEIGITKCKIYSADYTRDPFYAATKIQAVYDHVVDFIKWYNENKQP